MGLFAVFSQITCCTCSTLRQRRVFVWLAVVAMVNVLGQRLYFNIYKNTCSTEGSHAMIADTCTQYRMGVVAGSLCPALCDNDAISYRHCVNWRFGKTVAYMDYTKTSGSVQRLVLKAMLNPSDNNFTLYDFVEDKANHTALQLMASLKQNLIRLLKHKYDFNLENTNSDLLTHMWGHNLTSYVANSHDQLDSARAAVRSLWFLAQQREYVFSKFFQNHTFATKIVGTCGAMYFLEYTQSINELKSGFFHGRGLAIYTQDWEKRAEYAMKILQLLPTLQTQFPQPVIMCDIKEANFGLRDDNDIVLIDSDDIHYESSRLNLYSTQSCTAHAQCGFQTCPGLCDKEKRICKRERSNNDLQSVCERVFLNKVGFAQTGLLSGAPSTVKRELSTLLDLCAYPPRGTSPTWNDRHVIHRPPDMIRDRLIEVLKRGIGS